MEPISITTPITQAWERMVRILFQPFDLKKWALLGFCSFLATLGQGGGNYNSNSMNQNQGGGGPDFEGEILPWIEDHIALIVLVVLALVLFIVLLTVLLTWLRSRGDFMFIDGIARNRGAVKEPWRSYRGLANSLFKIRAVIGVLSFLLIAGGMAGFAYALWVAIGSGGDFVFPWLAVGVFVPVVTVVAIASGIIGFVLSDLVLPTMYANDVKVGEAWAIVKADLLPGNLGTIVLYVLMKFALGIGVALVAILALFLTCCLAALPYVGSVILLPLSVFMRGFNLYFVQQFGKRFVVFRHEDEAFGAVDLDGVDDQIGPAGGENPDPYEDL